MRARVLLLAASIPAIQASSGPCLRIVTGTVQYSDGTLDVSVDQGSGYAAVTSGQNWATGSTVVQTCYTTLLGVRVTNPSTNGWIGDIEVSEGSGYMPLNCTDCNVKGSTADIVVDGDSNGAGMAANECLNGATCTLVPYPSPPLSPPLPPFPLLPPSPLPPLPPPPRLATVGDDPLFLGGDGVPYEVRGTAGVVFNLVSAAELSINARFVGVPEAFKAEDITETVLGDVGIALCDERSALRTLTFTADGRLELDGAVVLGARGDAEGFALELTRLVCDLGKMACGWRVHDGAPLRLPLFDGGHSRIKLRTERANVTVTRNAMVDLGAGTAIDCAEFARWATAAAACMAAQQGGASHEVVLMLDGPKLRQEQRFHFMEVELNQLDMQAGEVHGLLGQRALQTAAIEGADPGNSAWRRVGVVTTGAAELMEAARRFGAQGEGAIEGVVGDYRRVALDEHGGARFAPFGWCR